MPDEPVTPVLFRVDRRGEFKGEVTAVFPLQDEGRGEVACYAHVGQHGTCDRGWLLSQTRPATEAEYAALKRELESAPYHYRLKVYRRAPRRS